MADFRIPPRVPPPVAAKPVAAPARPEAARTAQAAFFKAARADVAASAPPKAAVEPSSDRPLRPGSLLDIKV